MCRVNSLTNIKNYTGDHIVALIRIGQKFQCVHGVISVSNTPEYDMEKAKRRFFNNLDKETAYRPVFIDLALKEAAKHMRRYTPIYIGPYKLKTAQIQDFFRAPSKEWYKALSDISEKNPAKFYHAIKGILTTS